MEKKLVLIGAGSSMFTQGIVLDLIENPGKYKWKLALVDIDSEVLNSITKLVKKMIAAKNADIEISSSIDRCDVLPGADYVFSTIGVGGRRAWEQDVIIPRKYGIYQPVGDTAMPGGISRAMRMIPAMIDITKDIMRLCPKARFINYSNPMTAICRAIRKSTGFPVIGLCTGLPGTESSLADFAGLDKKKVTSYAVGINHLTFLYDLRCEGKDAWPIVRQKLEEEYKGEFNENLIKRFYNDETNGFSSLGDPFAWTIFNEYNAYPAPGDRHITEFLTEGFPHGKYYGKTLGIDAYSFESTIECGDKIFDDMVKIANSDETLTEKFFQHAHGEHEQAIEIINCFETDGRKVYSVNLPNNGAVPNLPKDAVIEMPAIATASGFKPLQINDFPDVLAGIISRYLAIVEITVEAALKGDKKLFEEAILMGGYISDKKSISNMVSELIKVQKQYLPQYK